MTYFDLLLNRFAGDKEVSSILYFHKAVCMSKLSYSINVNLDAIGYYGANERDSCYRDGTGKIKYYSRKKTISSPFEKSILLCLL